MRGRVSRSTELGDGFCVRDNFKYRELAAQRQRNYEQEN